MAKLPSSMKYAIVRFSINNSSEYGIFAMKVSQNKKAARFGRTALILIIERLLSFYLELNSNKYLAVQTNFGFVGT